MPLPPWQDGMLAAWPLMYADGEGGCITVCVTYIFSPFPLFWICIYHGCSLPRAAVVVCLKQLLYTTCVINGAALWQQGGGLSGLQIHKTGPLLTSPLFTKWSEQPKGCWLENNKCCYRRLEPGQDTAYAVCSLIYINTHTHTYVCVSMLFRKVNELHEHRC